MEQALYKSETPRLELKSLRTFLAIKRCKRTNIQKDIKLAQSSKKKWSQIICNHSGYLRLSCFNLKIETGNSALFIKQYGQAIVDNLLWPGGHSM
jgi:hypothetical protein